MPKVLIICDVYPPSFAPRMGYLVKYMKALGWSADIVTRELDGDVSFKSLLGNESVIRVKGISVPMKTAMDKVFRLLTLKQTHKKNANLISDKIINKLHAEEYTLILCSTAHRTFILDATNKVAKAWKKPWVIDIRDLYEQIPVKTLPYKGMRKILLGTIEKNLIHYTIKQRNKCFKNANAITSVSPWHVQTIKNYNHSTYLIYNGYDPETYFPKKINNLKTFNITYTGTVLPERHNPELLFKATKRLKEKGIINNNDFRIQFYVPKNWRKNITESPTYNDIRNFVTFNDYIDTSEVPQLLNESAILLLLSNLYTPDGPKGLISTTKYFEYLAVERPILCVRSDENLLEASIKEASVGVSARTIEETYDFLLEKWNEWKVKGHTTVKINRNYTQQFSRKLQAKQFVDLFQQVINT